MLFAATCDQTLLDSNAGEIEEVEEVEEVEVGKVAKVALSLGRLFISVFILQFRCLLGYFAVSDRTEGKSGEQACFITGKSISYLICSSVITIAVYTLHFGWHRARAVEMFTAITVI